MIKGKQIKVSELSKTAKEALTYLKKKNGKSYKSSDLRNYLSRKMKVSDRTAYRIITELHLSDQLSSSKTYNVNVGR